MLFRSYEIAQSKKIESANAANELNTILADRDVVSLGYGADCFDPHHAVRFGTGSDQIDIIICFECSNVQVYFGEPTHKFHFDFNEYCLREPSTLKKFLAQYFPNDERLKSSGLEGQGK